MMKRKLLFTLAALLVAATTVNASTENECFYAVFSADGKTMTLMCATYNHIPVTHNGIYRGGTRGSWSGPTDNKSEDWDEPIKAVTTVIVDESCEKYDGYYLSELFKGFQSLTSITDLSYLNTQNVTTVSQMFSNCKSLTTLDLTGSGFDEQVKDMSMMFENCTKLTTIKKFDALNTAGVTNMSGVFSGCSSLTSLDLSTFNTAKVERMSEMFKGCSRLRSITFGSGFNTANVTDMSHMFKDCADLTGLDLSGFNTANVTNMSHMFQGCSALTALDLSSFDTEKVMNMENMFAQCIALTALDLSGFNTEKVTSTNMMFQECSALTALDLSTFNTANVINMGAMFINCGALTSLDLSGFDTANVTSMSEMFGNCTSLTALDLSAFNTAGISQTDYMFEGCTALKTILVGSGWNISSVSSGDSSGMFEDCTALVGEDGTAYNSSSTDKTRAHTGDGGYLTKKTVDVTANEAEGYHWATYYQSSVNRQADDATKVYVVKHDLEALDKINLFEVEDRIIMAGQAVLLRSDNATATLTTVAANTTAVSPNGSGESIYAGNYLKGTDKSVAKPSDPSHEYYVLSNGSQGVGFYKYAGSTLGAHKAYIPYAIQTGKVSEAPAMFALGNGDGQTAALGNGAGQTTALGNGDGATAISGTELTPADEASDAAYYTLQGRRLTARPAQKGIYVTGGKKVIIK